MIKKEIITKSEMIAITNSITGEMETAKVTINVSRDRPKFKNEPFTLLFQASTKIISRNITPVTAKMLIHLCSIVDYNNYIPQGKKEMANELGYSIRQVERALKELVEMKVLLKSEHPQDARMVMFHINPLQSWKGNVKERTKKISEYNPNQLEMFPEGKKLIGITPNEAF